jgi:cytoskeletal protein CcmA (bactofilin family)
MWFGKAHNGDDSNKEFPDRRAAPERADPAPDWQAPPPGESSSVTKGEPTLAPFSKATPIVSTTSADVPAPADPGSSMVSKGTVWQGTLKVEGSVRIDGQLTGEVESRQLVYVAEGAEVDAQIRAGCLTIGGRFQGKVHCTDRLEILPTGWVTADLTARSIVVHEGAVLEGQIHMEGGSGKGASGTPGKEVLDAAERGKAPTLGAASPSSSAPLGAPSPGPTGANASGALSLNSSTRNPIPT